MVDVVTGADLDLPALPGTGNPAMARPLLATDRVRFVGEPVAVVLTERAEQGVDAVEQVVVDYDPLPAVVDPSPADDCGRHGAVPRRGDQLVGAFGDADGADAPGGPRVRGRGPPPDRQPAGGAVPLEGRSSAAAWIDGRLVLWCSTQNAHGVARRPRGTYGLDPVTSA